MIFFSIAKESMGGCSDPTTYFISVKLGEVKHEVVSNCANDPDVVRIAEKIERLIN